MVNDYYFLTATPSVAPCDTQGLTLQQFQQYFSALDQGLPTGSLYPDARVGGASGYLSVLPDNTVLNSQP